jgi:kinesin family protein C2/C3
MEKEAMPAGHMMVPLQSLSLELPDGEIVVGYNDTSALQG